MNNTPPSPRRGAWRGVALPWLATRAVLVCLLLTVERVATGDVTYYWSKIAGLAEVGLDQTLVEYPAPVAWMLAIPYGVSQLPQLLGADSQVSFTVVFIVAMLGLDAAFTRTLWRAAGSNRDTSVTFWLLFIFFLGPVSYLRFDLVPAVLVGFALLVLRRRPAVTGMLTGLGAAIKLWPALLIAPFTTARKQRARPLAGLLLIGAVLALLSIVFGGLGRLVSPLTWQSARGLQIESLWATPLMFLRLFQPNRWIVATSRYQAFEIFGPAIPVWLTVSAVATVAGIIFLAMIFLRTYRRIRPPTATAIGLMVLATITVMTVTNKTLSPQYLLWLAGPMAVMLIGGRRGHRPRSPVRFAVAALALALATQLIYPLTYAGLYGEPHGTLFRIATLLLALRNLGLLAFTVAVCVAGWRALGTSQYQRSSRREHRRGTRRDADPSGP